MANQYIITIGDFTYFQSYGAFIARTYIHDKRVFLIKDWNCSRTTVKYLSKFLGIETKDIKNRIASGDYVVVETIETTGE